MSSLTAQLIDGGSALQLNARSLSAGAAFVLLGMVVGCASLRSATSILLNPTAMPRIGIVDERFQSYNIEMLEVTRGEAYLRQS